uniref:acid phosphatase n=1 Tax=Meloidogyne incognita TaxID=6306 RepID=Q7YWJ0_MELIC|nr:putative esophageal gland cell secretory protein 21 [Meloidogyne incognita]
MKCLLPFFWILLTIFVSCTNGTSNEYSELVLVQALWRHGDRSPTKTFKTDKYQEKDWPQGWGQLTPTGMAQHVELGRRLRQRYIEELKFVGPRYNSHEIYVRSTDWNRTLTSAISNFIGFYGPGNDDEYPKDLGANKWPGWFFPIAIHSLPGNEDFMAPGESECKRFEQIKERITLTEEYNSTLIKYKWLLDFLSEKTGQNVDPFDMWMINDAFYIEKLKGKKLVDWAEGNQTLLDTIAELDNLQERWMVGLDLKPLGDANFREELPKILGGPILWKFITNMQEKLACSKRMNSVKEIDREIEGRKSPMGTPLCKWMNKMRYFAYSAHDSTIIAIFAALGLNKTNYDEDGYPKYSTCVTFELWREKNTGQFDVKVFLWRPNTNETSPKEITTDIEGCQSNSTLEQFVERSKNYQMLPSPKDYCSQLLQPLNNAARMLIQWKLEMLILMGIPSIVANVV